MGGGGGGGSRSIGDIQSLVDKAKAELREGQQAGKRNVFISFAMEDETTVNALRASAKNPKSPIEFNDWSVSEPINSDRATYIKQKIADRIAQCSVTVVFLSSATQKSAWVSWEIEESLKQGKHVIGVYPKDGKPTTMPDAIRANRIKCVQWSELADLIGKLP
jgi:hypothetical protein